MTKSNTTDSNHQSNMVISADNIRKCYAFLNAGTNRRTITKKNDKVGVIIFFYAVFIIPNEKYNRI